jgi:hypothetical protein
MDCLWVRVVGRRMSQWNAQASCFLVLTWGWLLERRKFTTDWALRQRQAPAHSGAI